VHQLNIEVLFILLLRKAERLDKVKGEHIFELMEDGVSMLKNTREL